MGVNLNYKDSIDVVSCIDVNGSLFVHFSHIQGRVSHYGKCVVLSPILFKN